MAFATLRRLSFQQTDAQRVPIGDPEIVEAGDRVPDYVKPFEISALAAAGVIVQLGEGDERRMRGVAAEARANELAPAMPNPEVPPTLAGNPVMPSLDAGPDDLMAVGGASFAQGGPVRFDSAAVREEGPAQGQTTSTEEPAATGSDATERPKASDNKEAWENYATTVGMDRAEAESMTKRDLMAEVERREATRS